jgi:hypothetical protein
MYEIFEHNHDLERAEATLEQVTAEWESLRQVSIGELSFTWGYAGGTRDFSSISATGVRELSFT